jgi:hypothetical protein
MRVSSGWGLAGLVIMGIIFADIIANPSGTSAASNGVVSILKPSYNALLGKTS